MGTKKRKRKNKRSQSEPPTTRRKSELPPFNFKCHCIFCGDKCLLKDKKNPGRWREVSLCTTADRDNKDDLKSVILDVCAKRGDQKANDVQIRVLGAPSDLHAADARYHRDCYKKFMGERNIRAVNTPEHKEDVSRERVQRVIEHMQSDPSHIWSTVELYDIFVGLCTEGTTMRRRDFISEVQTRLGDSLIKLDINGCASLLGFKDHLPKNLKLVKVDDNKETIMINELNKKIISETKEIPKQDDYDMSQFSRSKTIESTSPTLLALTSKLVSHGQVTRISITMAQAIQAKITKCWNQTTLGLAVKLHHRHDSKELVTQLHDYGITATYDEVLRFRTSAAIFTGNQPNNFF